MDSVGNHFNDVNASIPHIFTNVEMTTEVNNILLKSVFDLTLIFGDFANSSQGKFLQSHAETAAPLNLETLGRSQQQIMKINLDRNIELLNCSMMLGQHMHSQFSNASTAALNEPKHTS